MRFLKDKTKFVVGAALGFALIVIFWLTPEPLSLRLRFVHTTNSPQGLMGVFQLENHLDEPVTTAGGFYQSVGYTGLEPQKGAFGAAVHLTVAANATNKFEIGIPTHAGAHRLVLPWRPASKATPQYLNSLRARVHFRMARTFHVSPSTQWRWLGWIYSVSDPFETTPNERSR